jgi:hypothetical protein
MATERPEDERTDTPAAADENDTEGHTMATYQLGQTMARERQRQAEKAGREAGRFASGGPSKRRSLLDRLRGR